MPQALYNDESNIVGRAVFSCVSEVDDFRRAREALCEGGAGNTIALTLGAVRSYQQEIIVVEAF